MSRATFRALTVATAAGAAMTASVLTAAAGTAPSWHTTVVIGTSRVSNLFSIVATGPRNAWTVGIGGRRDTPLVLHWNGTEWQRATLPGTDAGPRQLSASSADNVWAYGFTCEGGPGSAPPSADISRWNGHRWATTLYGNLPWCPTGPLVTTSRADGWLFTGAQVAMHFHGTKWRAVRLANVGTVETVTALSSSDVWAFTVRDSDSKAFAIRWNGHGWRTVPLPDFREPGQHVVPIASYSSASTGLWISVARQGNESHPGSMLLHWTGHGWHKVAVPGTAIVDEMAADGTGGLWCVGNYPTANVSFAFLHYARGSWSSTPVPVSGLPGNPKRVGVSVYSIASIPDTHRLWATGELDFDNSQGNLQQYTVIDKFR